MRHHSIRLRLFSRCYYNEFGEVPHFYLFETLDIEGIGIMKLTQIHIDYFAPRIIPYFLLLDLPIINSPTTVEDNNLTIITLRIKLAKNKTLT